MRVLVTGGAGFIGSRTVRHLLAAGHSVLTLDCLTFSASLAGIWDLEEHPNYAFAPTDITDEAELSAQIQSFQPDAVLHLAGEGAFDSETSGVPSYVRTNIVGTQTLLDALRKHCAGWVNSETVRLLHVSCASVLGFDQPGTQVDEGALPAPEGPVAASRASAEHLVLASHHSFGAPTAVARISRAFGPRQAPTELLPSVLLKARAGETISLGGASEQIYDWIHVDDVARALLIVLEAGQVGACYHVASGHVMRELDLAKAACRILQGRAPAPHPYTGQIRVERDEAAKCGAAISAQKLRNELGWSPAFTLEQGVAQTLDWYLANQSWWRPLVPRSVQRRIGAA